MPVKYLTSLLVSLLISALVLPACRQAADSPQEARDRLLSAPDWVLSEIYVNDALSFKDGKMIESFGNVTFGRHMETVQFRKDGIFVGNFKGESEPMLLRWRIDSASGTIQVGAADATATAGEWTIAPVGVFKDSFEMKTQSTAYDYPQVTRITLKFNKAD
ncbi:hypothetical protein [Telluribacter sp.]|jgi:hypothetical protein|uniref:hypothetical protein n=1 Tax=Telluribacter sp. TaxID=1978767 RepID=UPI002E0D13D2|nr:hypothetical protein [Telluribacter sp.]